MTNIQKTNALAMEELSKGNELAAQILLRKNVNKKPCCLSLNNMGVYYIQYGVTLKNGRIKSAKKMGLKYLLRASLCEMDWRNCASTATALLEHGNLECAYQLLSQALLLKWDCKILYNIGACLYRLEKYQEAVSVFETLSKEEFVDQIVQNNGQHPLLVLAYCQIKLHNEQECIRHIQRFRKAHKTADRLDVFYIRYMCGLYEEALSEYFELLQEWYATKAVLALVGECTAYFPAYANEVENAMPPEHKKIWYALKKNRPLRLKEIDAYVYVPPLIDLYYYID